MKEIIREYQHIMGWNDQSIISILCDYIEAIQPATQRVGGQLLGGGFVSTETDNTSHLQEYLEQRAKEEEEMGGV